jgi:hypothetical protein
MKFIPFFSLIPPRKKTLITTISCMFSISLMKRYKGHIGKLAKKVKKGKKGGLQKIIEKLKSFYNQIFIDQCGNIRHKDDELARVLPDLPPIAFVAYGVVSPFQLIMREILKTTIMNKSKINACRVAYTDECIEDRFFSFDLKRIVQLFVVAVLTQVNNLTFRRFIDLSLIPLVPELFNVIHRRSMRIRPWGEAYQE